MNLLDVWKAEKRNLVRFGRATRRLYEEYADYRDIRPLLENLERNLMSQIERLQSAVSNQSVAINEMQQRVHEDIETLRSELATALAEKPELDALLTQIEQNTGSIDSLDPIVQDVVDEVGDGTPTPEAPTEAPAEEAPLPEDSPTPDTDEVPTGGPVEEPAAEEPVAEAPAEEAPAEEPAPEQGV